MTTVREECLSTVLFQHGLSVKKAYIDTIDRIPIQPEVRHGEGTRRGIQALFQIGRILTVCMFFWVYEKIALGIKQVYYASTEAGRLFCIVCFESWVSALGSRRHIRGGLRTLSEVRDVA